MTSGAWILVGVVLGGSLLGLLLFILVRELSPYWRKRCPQCGRRGELVAWRQVPGTLRKKRDYSEDESEAFVFVAEHLLSFKCPHCGQRWTKERTRRIDRLHT